MAYYCTMVHGPCKGRNCDFWARTKIKKASIEDLVTGFKNTVRECEDNGVPLENALIKYWKALGIKSIPQLCREEPDICIKMREVERQILS